MNQDQKTGALIIIVGVSLMVISLFLSTNIPNIPMFLFTFEWADENGSPKETLFRTTYVLSFLVLVVAYGIARYLSVIPPIFRKLKSDESKSEE